MGVGITFYQQLLKRIDQTFVQICKSFVGKHLKHNKKDIQEGRLITWNRFYSRRGLDVPFFLGLVYHLS